MTLAALLQVEPAPTQGWLFLLLAGLGAYLLGSIPFGYLIVKLREGRDIRASGSGNIGATNVARSAGKAAGALTLLLDAGKGFLPVWLVASYGITVMVAAAFCAILGHMFPVWLKFQGGKGVATGVGAFLPICWPGVAGAVLVWVATVGATRYVSLGSVLGAASLPVWTYFLYAPGFAPPLAVNLITVLVAILIILKHHENIRRLAGGEERKLKL